MKIDVRKLAKEADILDWGPVLEVAEPGPGKHRKLRAANMGDLSRFAAIALERAAESCDLIASQYRDRGGHAAECAGKAIRALKP